MKKICEACQSKIDEKATICPHCRTKQKRKMGTVGKVITVAILVIISLSIINGLFSSSSSHSNTATSTSDNNNAQAQNQPTPTTDPHPHFSDGVYVVGKDIQPGTYRTRQASSGCYYERLSGFGGSVDEIIENSNTDYPAVVTINATDKGFKSQNCGTWTQDLSQITTSKTSFGDGIYIVGTDIQPGTYKNTGASGCYYSRLSDFSGSTDSIISNDNTDSAAIVTIDATDAGFNSQNCGTWTLQQ